MPTFRLHAYEGGREALADALAPASDARPALPPTLRAWLDPQKLAAAKTREHIVRIEL